MNHNTLSLAGWTAMFSAFASLPAAYLSWTLEGRIDATATLLQSAMQLTGIVIFVVITLLLKKLLNGYFRFHDTDRNLQWMIKANVIAGILTLAALNSSDMKDAFGLAALVMLIAQGAVQVQFGYRLLRLEDDLGGLLKPFCYANMATGICVASIVLILVGIGLSAITDLMLGTIFFQIAKRQKITDALSND